MISQSSSLLYQEIVQRAEQAGELPAYISGEREIRYSTLCAGAESLAAQLRAAGACAGEILAFECRDEVLFLQTLIAGLELGMLLAPISAEVVAAEKYEILKRLSPRFLLVPTQQSLAAAVQESKDEPFSTATQQTLDYLAGESSAPSELSFFSFATNLDERLRKRCAFGGAVRFTSGTTGSSKGVVISTESARERILAAHQSFNLRQGERVLTLLAMPYHFVVSVLQFLRAGATIVRPAGSALGEIVRCFEHADAQVVYAAPFHWDVIAGSAKRCPADLRLCISTSSSLRSSTVERFVEKFQHRIANSYGIIELGIPIAMQDATDATSQGAVGRVLAGYEAAVLVDDVVKPEGRGTLLLRGPGMFDAYLTPMQERESVLTQGWFETGDIAEITSGHLIRLLGRSNSAIHIAGFKVFPEEIESILLEHPKVRSAQVVGVAHPSFGASIHAKILPSVASEFDESSLRAFCRKRIGALKTPHSFEVVEQLAKTATGKLLRR